MKAALFIPCYIDQFYPQVGIASLELLERLGIEVEVPLKATCCGQPFCNAGYENKGFPVMRRFARDFEKYDHIIVPSGSCTYHLKTHFDAHGDFLLTQKIHDSAIELCDFIFNVLGVKDTGAHFPHIVGLHQSCHGLRGLRMGVASELVATGTNIMEELLQSVKGLELIELDRKDECCGFGGTFSVTEPEVSVKMGKDRIGDHLAHGASYVTSADMSCLMHLEGIMKREGTPLKVIHIAEILNAQ